MQKTWYKLLKENNDGHKVGHVNATSALLKLLRLRLTLRSPGRSDLVPGTTTAFALALIHASPPTGVVAFRLNALALTSLALEPADAAVVPVVAVAFPRRPETSVGSREGVGDAARAFCRCCCERVLIEVALRGGKDFSSTLDMPGAPTGAVWV